MPLLARAKRQVATRLGGDPLILADAAETRICVLLSVSTLAGLGLFTLTGAAWLDPVAGFVIAIFAIHEGREAWAGDLSRATTTGRPPSGTSADEHVRRDDGHGRALRRLCGRVDRACAVRSRNGLDRGSTVHLEWPASRLTRVTGKSENAGPTRFRGRSSKSRLRAAASPRSPDRRQANNSYVEVTTTVSIRIAGDGLCPILGHCLNRTQQRLPFGVRRCSLMSEAHGLPEPPSRQAVGFTFPLIWRAAFTQPWSPAQIGSSQRLSRWLPDHLNKKQPRRRADHQIAAKLTAGVDLDLRDSSTRPTSHCLSMVRPRRVDIWPGATWSSPRVP